jgi:PAS domain S-box-containing protein
MRVLLVDDNENDRFILRTFLKRSGHEVHEAANGEDGLALALQLRLDAVISDVQMPMMDGFQLLRELRVRPELSGLLFVFYTGIYAGEQEKELALSLGADALITKAQDCADSWPLLKEVLDAALQRPHPRPPSLEDDEFIRRFGQVASAKLEEKIRELEESRTRYYNLFNSIRDVVVVTDGRGIVVDVNPPALRELFGYERDELVGLPVDLLCPPGGDSQDLCRRILSADVSQVQELDMVTHDGALVRCEISTSALVDGRGRTTGTLGIIRDIRERHELEEHLRHAQKLEAIGTLSGGIAHDFNNILTTIVGYATILQMKIPSENPLQKEVRCILDASERAAALTSGLLAFSRKQVLKLQPVNINMLISDMQRLLGRIIGEDIHICTAPWKEDLVVLVDRGQMEQVLMNLLINARDAMPGGGELIVGTEVRTMDESFIRRHGFGDPGDYGVNTVSDTGCGMDEETRTRIFDPFFTTKETGKGTGLGLAMVFGIIKQHKGFIDCYSEVGKGSTFTVYLPLAHHKDEQEAVEAPKDMARGKEAILLAEDDGGVRALAREILEDAGYKVHTAEDGVEAVERYREIGAEVDLLVFDLMMPRKNGREALEEIRAINPGCRALFMSGYTADILKNKGIGEAGIPIIGKPMSPNVMLDMVRKALDGA